MAAQASLTTTGEPTVSALMHMYNGHTQTDTHTWHLRSLYSSKFSFFQSGCVVEGAVRSEHDLSVIHSF